jgi:hypothetical protein
MAQRKGKVKGHACVPCYWILRYLCENGNDPRLCDAFGLYAQTHSTDALDMALESAPPQLLTQARQHLVDLGIASYQ